jgi:predicted  nucleic acid-binding Zn-ribbon protein
MIDYEKLFQSSEENVNRLKKALISFEQLYNDIAGQGKEAKNIRREFETKFREISNLAEQYLIATSSAVKLYIDGNNEMLTNSLKEIEENNTTLGALIKTLEIQVTRLSNIDLEKHFEKHQKTLSDIFGAINNINTNLTGLSQNIINVIHLVAKLQSEIDDQKVKIDKGFTATIDLTNNKFKSLDESLNTKFKSAEESLNTKFKSTEESLNNKFQIVLNKIKLLEDGQNQIKKSVAINRIILIIGLLTVCGLLIRLLNMHS